MTSQWAIDHWPEIQAWLVHIGVSVISALAAVGFTFRVFGERLVGHYFDRRLEALKQQGAQELEQLKAVQAQTLEQLRTALAHLSDRSKHSNEREYAAASALWELAVDLYYATNNCVISDAEYPPLNKMPTEELTEFLNTTEFSESQKRLVLQATDKERSYSHILGRRYINAALNQVSLLNAALHKQGVFVPGGLAGEFESFKMLCISAIAQRRTEHGESFRTGLKHDLEFLQQGTPRLEDLKASVRKRLLHP